MVQIYELRDPRDDKPFYVGASVCKASAIYNRHQYEAFYGFGIVTKRTNDACLAKRLTIRAIKEAGLRFQVHVIRVVGYDEARAAEREHYQALIAQGHTLHQQPFAFNYATQKPTEENQKGWRA